MRTARTFPFHSGGGCTCRAAIGAALVVGIAGCSSLSPMGEPRISSLDAYDLSTRGELRIIDIRPDDERTRDGWPIDAMPVPFPTGPFANHGRFIDRVTNVTHGDRDHPLALLCRRGVTSRRAQTVLTKAGFRSVFNIADGFLGSESGPGWKRWGLPVGAPVQPVSAAGTVR